MKFTATPLALVLAAVGTQRVAADSWNCNGNSQDGSLHRYSFTFQGYCENRFGLCFLDSIRNYGIADHNWQAWNRGDGWWQVDVSAAAGSAPVMNNAIQAVTGLWRGCWNGA
ncbi:hypothetical protein GQ53DRAFT_757929 [Thozetella sp. PMI_491]|nr:hypothetical protein GQ53DRAFT_757929 [Thozetella sp. PMI_491]